MKSILKISLILVAATFLAACSSDGGSQINPEGPVLSADEVAGIIIDQLYINGGLEDEYSGKGEFAVYLRDAATDKDLACAAGADGMKGFTKAGIYVGGLAIPLREVTGDHPTGSASFKVVFVEKDSEDCPNQVGGDDDIAGASAEFSFDGLLNKEIWASNGRAMVVFRTAADENLSVAAMAPSVADGLAIDKLYFEDGSNYNDTHTYYIFAEKVLDGEVVEQCQIDSTSMEAVGFGGVVYAALGFPFNCFDPADASFAATPVRVSLYVQGDSTELVAETEVKTIGDLIGEKVSLGGNNYISFRGVMEAPFSSSVVRLVDLTKLYVTALQYNTAPSSNSNLEMEIISPSDGFVIACAGSEQGLTGVEAAGAHAGLNVQFVAAEGIEELFGWEGVKIRFVNRTDGYKCPTSLTKEPDTVAETGALSTSNLGAKTISFESGAGSVTLGL